MDVEVKGSALYPTVVGLPGHKAVMANSDVEFDISKCVPEFVSVS